MTREEAFRFTIAEIKSIADGSQLYFTTYAYGIRQKQAEEALVELNNFEQQLNTAQSTIEAQEIVIADMRKRIEELETQRFTLWMLLDNIDTAEDIAKSDDKLFRGLCRNQYKNRWSVYEPKEEQ